MMPYNINDYKPFREGNHSVFPSSENGCRHVGNNTKRQYVRHFKVDGEVFRGPGEERCDYLLLNDEAATSYYIELKGSDLPKAIRQIENTIKLLSPSLPGYAVLRRIVYHTGSHNVHASEVLRWKARYKAVVKERAYSFDKGDSSCTIVLHLRNKTKLSISDAVCGCGKNSVVFISR